MRSLTLYLYVYTVFCVAVCCLYGTIVLYAVLWILKSYYRLLYPIYGDAGNIAHEGNP